METKKPSHRVHTKAPPRWKRQVYFTLCRRATPRLAKRRVARSQTSVSGPMIEHHVYDNAGDGYVHPHRKRDPRDFPMLDEPCSARQKKRAQDERNGGDGQDHVREQDRQIDELEPSAARKAMRAGQIKPREIADEKDRRRDEGRLHREAVQRDLARLDRAPTNEQEGGAGGVESGIDGGQCVDEGQHHAPFSAMSVSMASFSRPMPSGSVSK